MADVTGNTFLNGTSPLFQYADGIWNHGEGLVGTTSDADDGGWFEEDDGSRVNLAKVHTTHAWSSWTWSSPFYSTPKVIRRFVGHLRPVGLPLPTSHPLYGPLLAGQGPFNNGSYVDQGAFEIFAPQHLPAPGQKIVIAIYMYQTYPFPADFAGNSFGWSLYTGIYSPDGLARNELQPGPPSMANFLANTAIGYTSVQRPSHIDEFVGAAQAYGATYYPISAYAVLNVPGRQTTLNEQRSMQLLQAIQLLLQSSSPQSPIYPQVLTPAEAEQQVVVVFGGGSNGGHQVMWASMRYPHRIHGVFSQVINPSIQRLFGEHDLGWLHGQLAGWSGVGATVTESDFLHWGQYAWNQDYWIHDLSFSRRQARSQIFRPSYFRVGDEDITSTGTDWAGTISPTGAWAAYGLSVISNGTPSWNVPSQMAWSVSRAARHGSVAATVNPYTDQTTWHTMSTTHELVNATIAHRNAELNTQPTPTIGTIAAENRSSQLRGLEDPHEWALGRPGAPMAPTSTSLTEDRTWFDAVQPGAAGTWLGYKGAMLIHDQRVYVLGAEGVVTAFVVDTTPGNRQRLVKVAQTHTPGTPNEPMSLGLEGFAMAALPISGGWNLVVGTRRHLYRLNPANLDVLQGPVEIPWEVAQPHHMKVADVLPSNAGDEIVFASVHGGLVFYSASLQPLYEWPEPGIVDFAVLGGSTVAVLSSRGVVANVDFSTQPPALSAASRPIPRRLQEVVPPSAYDPALDSPSQGRPIDLVLMKVPGDPSATVMPLAMWTGDEDSTGDTVAVRRYDPMTLSVEPFATMIPSAGTGFGWQAMATCPQPGSSGPVMSADQAGDHLLVLHGDRLSLYDSTGALLGAKVPHKMTTTAPDPNWYTPFGKHLIALAVGDLVGNSSTSYEEEVVVATQSGALLWLHVDDLMPAGDALGSAYNLTVGTPSSNMQPRTNQSMSATWAIAQRAGDPGQLHLLDQRGAYWTVNHSGEVRLRDRDPKPVNCRGYRLLQLHPRGKHEPESRLPEGGLRLGEFRRLAL